jgi:hypothetical protein
MSDRVKEILELLEQCTEDQRKAVFAVLRKSIHIHAVEAKLTTRAEIILEAISKDEKGLTFRMLRGVIAEAAFGIEVIDKLEGWTAKPATGDRAYDYLLDDGKGPVSVQVKLQRSKEFKPMTAKQASRKFPEDMWVVETQKTRGGKDADDSDTRPYRFGEFDILAVAMQPSTGDWAKFMYCVSAWLRPDPSDKTRINKFQPVAMKSNDIWTDSFEECVTRLRSKETKFNSVVSDPLGLF